MRKMILRLKFELETLLLFSAFKLKWQRIAEKSLFANMSVKMNYHGLHPSFKDKLLDVATLHLPCRVVRSLMPDMISDPC